MPEQLPARKSGQARRPRPPDLAAERVRLRSAALSRGPDREVASAARTAHALGNRLEGNESAEARLG